MTNHSSLSYRSQQTKWMTGNNQDLEPDVLDLQGYLQELPEPDCLGSSAAAISNNYLIMIISYLSISRSNRRASGIRCLAA